MPTTTVLDYFAPNDIVFNHWQTNIDFYKVTKVTKSFITLEAIGSTVTKYHKSGDAEVMPDTDTILCEDCISQNGRYGIRIHDDAVFVNFKH